jgi:trichothecene 3-O-acetyltransferase
MEVPVVQPASKDPQDFSVYIDTLGQASMLNIYTQISLVYPVEDASSQSLIIKTLTAGLNRLTHSFPWVAGQVLPEKSSPGLAVAYSIKPFEPIPRLIVKDLTNVSDAPTIDGLRKANFPFSMLDENVVAPRMTFPKIDREGAGVPVFAVQANFIKGGLILTLVGQHQAMDMIGLGLCITWLSRACYPNCTFSEDELEHGNMDRKNLIPIVEDESYKSDPHLAKQIPNPFVQTIEAGTPSTKDEWKYFSFSGESLANLKAEAMETIPKGASYVSTDDTLGAFIWQAITRARAARLENLQDITATFSRAVDVRRYLNIPDTYPGILQNHAYTTLPVVEVIDKSNLGSIAWQMRQVVDPKTSTLAQHTRALITFLEHSDDKAAAYVTASLNLDVDLMYSSWSKVDCYSCDFALGLGMPESVRRPLFEAVNSLLYAMPKRPDGEVSVAISLREDDMSRLKNDAEMQKFAVYID